MIQEQGLRQLSPETKPEPPPVEPLLPEPLLPEPLLPEPLLPEPLLPEPLLLEPPLPGFLLASSCFFFSSSSLR